MKKIWAIRKDAEAVSPVIATILMVAITVVLAAVLYVMVLGFGGGGTNTPTATYSDDSSPGGREVQILSISRDDVPWTDVTIQVKSGTTFWNAEITDANEATLSGSPGSSANVTVDSTGHDMWCTVVDIGGDGMVSGSDYFVLTGAWVDGEQYQAYLLYEESNSAIGQGPEWTA